MPLLFIVGNMKYRTLFIGLVSYFIFVNVVIIALMIPISGFDKVKLEIIISELFMPKNIWLGVLTQMIQFLGVVLCVNFFFKREVKKYNVSLLSFVNGVCIGILPIGVVMFVLTSLDIYNISSHNIDVYYLIGGAFLCLLISLTEEFLIRGAVYSYLEKYAGKKYYPLIISSLIFALFHVFSLDFSIYYILELIMAGVFLGSFIYKNQSIYMSIGAHFILNFTVLFICSFSEISLKTVGVFQFELKNPNDMIMFVSNKYILSFLTLIMYGVTSFLLLSKFNLVRSKK